MSERLTPSAETPRRSAGERATTGRSVGSRLRRWAGNLLLLALSATVASLLAEAGIRLLAPQQPILLRPDIWQPDDTGLGWVQAPNLDTRVNTGEGEVRLLTDGAGHRVGAGPRPAAAHRILALGDSYVAALQVEYEQTLTARAERRLSRESGAPVEVVNAAVGGWGPSHYLLKARQELARGGYDQVVVFFYLGNDVEHKRVDRFGPKQPAIRHRLRWPRRLTRGELVDALLYPVNDVLETRSHLFLLIKKRLWFLLMRFGLSARHFPPALLLEQASADGWRVSAEVCRSIADEAETRGLPVLFVLLPGVCEVDREIAEITARAVGIEVARFDPDQPSRRMRHELEGLGLEVLDATPALRAAHAVGVDDLYGRVDIHFGAGGHRVVADAVAPRLLESLDLEALGETSLGAPR